jgi:regulator of protease activity HflC (stomatin/prohibitin superfamily)
VVTTVAFWHDEWVVVPAHERAVVFVNGVVGPVLAPGRHRVPRWRRRRQVVVTRVDVRRSWTVLANQEVMTADVPGVRVSVAAQWRVVDPVAWLGVAADPADALRMAVQLALRDVLAGREVASLVADRGETGAQLRERVAAEAAALGAEVLRVELRDVAPPAEVRRSALALFTARQDGLARLEAARAETAALRALANGAKVLAEHPALLQLRTAEAVAAAGGVVKLTLPS